MGRSIAEMARALPAAIAADASVESTSTESTKTISARRAAVASPVPEDESESGTEPGTEPGVRVAPVPDPEGTVFDPDGTPDWNPAMVRVIRPAVPVPPPMPVYGGLVPFPEPRLEQTFDIEQLKPETFLSVTGVKRISGGNIGALAAFEVGERGAFIVKVNQYEADTLNEFHATQLFGRGPGAVVVPKMKLVEKSRYIGCIRQLYMRYSGRRGIIDFAEETLWKRLVSPGASSFLVMEFVPGHTLKDAQRGLFDGAAGRVRLFCMGIISAYDLVILNNDRGAGVITRGFNQGNLMFSGAAKRPVAIDSMVAQNKPDDIAAAQDTRDILTLSQSLRTVLSDPQAALDIGNQMVAKINRRSGAITNTREAAQIIADGIQQGLRQLMSTDGRTIDGRLPAVRELIDHMQTFDTDRARLVEENFRMLRARGRWSKLSRSIRGARAGAP